MGLTAVTSRLLSIVYGVVLGTGIADPIEKIGILSIVGLLVNQETIRSSCG